MSSLWPKKSCFSNIVILIVIIGLQQTNSQVKQNENTTQYPRETTTLPPFSHIQRINNPTKTDATVEQKPTEVTESENKTNESPGEVVRQQRSGFIIDEGLIREELNSNEPLVKIINAKEPTVPASASKVVINNNSTDTIRNNIRTEQKQPTKHPVEELDDDFAKAILKEEATRNIKKVEEKLQVRYDENTGELIRNDQHPCLRECQEGEDPMICYYHFDLEWYQTMSKACYDCPYVEEDCNRLDCIPGDGVSRALTVINRKMPGPAIEVCQNDRIIVDLENSLMTEATSIHWHGIHQKGTPYMDGTPYVTQCPVLPENGFRYQFNATQYGTHFWHSHSGMQRADGAAGALIIRQPKSQDVHSRLYDYDRSEHSMLVTDWIHELGISMFADHHHSTGDNKPPGLLINGLGRFKVFNQTADKNLYIKTARFNVEQGYRYRFRLINAEFLNCPVELAIVGHNITLIASDGNDLEPVTATSIVSYAGERFDFIVEANNEIDNYWIIIRGLMDCDPRFTKAKQVGVLHYEGAMEEEPEGELTYEESHIDGLQINALNKGEEDEETLSIPELRSIAGHDDSLKEIPDYQFYIGYDFYMKDNTVYHKPNYYGFFQVNNKSNQVLTPQLNHISMKMPSSPLLLSRPSPDNFCNASSVDPSCKDNHCTCSHVLSVKLGAVVEVIIVDEGVAYDANHPFHLHGHNFRVIGMRRLSNTTTVDEVKEFDRKGLMSRNLKNAPLKDTVTVPDGGYTIIRFKADNPGYWLFHCHIEFHVEVGMALVFKVGEHKDMPPIPPSFPTCGSYMPDNMLEHATTEKAPEGSYFSLSHWWPLVVSKDLVVTVNSTSNASAILLSNVLVAFSLCVSLLALMH